MRRLFESQNFSVKRLQRVQIGKIKLGELKIGQMADIDRTGNKNFTVGIMKTNCWLILGMMVATGAIAQDNTNVPTPDVLPPIPAPVTSPAAEVAPAPADTGVPEARHARHVRTVTPKKLVEPTVTLVPGAAEVAVTNLNVRGQAGLKGEVLTHLNPAIP